MHEREQELNYYFLRIRRLVKWFLKGLGQAGGVEGGLIPCKMLVVSLRVVNRSSWSQGVQDERPLFLSAKVSLRVILEESLKGAVMSVF